MPEPLIIPDGPEITRRVLNRECISTYRVISRYVIANANFRVVEDEAAGMVVQLVSEVLTEKITGESKTVRLDIPASWWESFKQTFSDSWWLRRFVKRYPVKMTTLENTVTFERYARYPNADVPEQVTPLGRPIYFEDITQTGWRIS